MDYLSELWGPERYVRKYDYPTLIDAGPGNFQIGQAIQIQILGTPYSTFGHNSELSMVSPELKRIKYGVPRIGIELVMVSPEFVPRIPR